MNNPRRAAYNRIYNWTAVGLGEVCGVLVGAVVIGVAWPWR